MDLSTHGIVALVINEDGKFLLLKESRDLLNGAWAPPHGRCEATDNSEEEGVVREVKEEVGLDVKTVKKLLTQPADTKVKTVSFWLVELVGGELEIDPGEASESGWFTLDEALDLNLYPGTNIFFQKVKSGEIGLA
jgi:ADP-ribose pyrophosphatase YjhB (NUDIX family)